MTDCLKHGIAYQTGYLTPVNPHSNIQSTLIADDARMIFLQLKYPNYIHYSHDLRVSP